MVRSTDITAIVESLPSCRAIVTAGQKATDVVVGQFGCKEPAVGRCERIVVAGREIDFWRMPSSSRAYTLKLERKADTYRVKFEAIL